MPTSSTLTKTFVFPPATAPRKEMTCGNNFETANKQDRTNFDVCYTSCYNAGRISGRLLFLYESAFILIECAVSGRRTTLLLVSVLFARRIHENKTRSHVRRKHLTSGHERLVPRLNKLVNIDRRTACLCLETRL